MKRVNLCGAFFDQAQRHPDRPALLQGQGADRRALSYSELAASIQALAGGLAARGLKAGQRVLVFVPMSIELYQCLMACFHLGASAVFLDAWSEKDRLEAAVDLASPSMMLGSPKAQILRLWSWRLRRIPQNIVVGRRFFGLERLKGSPVSKPAALHPGHEALVTFTTGSTGKPKGAARSHAFLLAQAKALTQSFGEFPGSVDMPTLPAFVLLNLFQGATSVIADLDPRKPADCDPGRVLAQMRAEGVESSSGSPAFYEKLIQVGKLPLKRLYTGGAAVPPALAQRLAQSCEGEVQIVYGSTEAEPIAHCSARELVTESKKGKLGLLAGKPRGIKLRILRASDRPERGSIQKLTLRRGQIGEIAVAGGHVQKAYLNDPEGVRRNKISDGREVWHRTGDAGYLDGRGRLFLVGRLGQRVERSGKTYWSLPLEQKAMGLAGVSFAAYLPAHDEAGKILVLLVLETSQRPNEADVKKIMAGAPMDRLVCMERVPRDPRHASKLDRGALLRKLGLS